MKEDSRFTTLVLSGAREILSWCKSYIIDVFATDNVLRSFSLIYKESEHKREVPVNKIYLRTAYSVDPSEIPLIIIDIEPSEVEIPSFGFTSPEMDYDLGDREKKDYSVLSSYRLVVRLKDIDYLRILSLSDLLSIYLLSPKFLSYLIERGVDVRGKVLNRSKTTSTVGDKVYFEITLSMELIAPISRIAFGEEVGVIKGEIVGLKDV